MFRIAAILVSLLLCVQAHAREIAGVEFPETLTQADGTELQLNGVGIRSKFVFKIYAAGLYLKEKQSDAKAVLAGKGGKRMVMHFLYSEVGKDDLVEAWIEGFEGNGTQSQLSALSTEIDSFNEMFDTVREGDRIILDYMPEVGTAVVIRDEQKGVIKGKEFNDLLLSIWLGEKPVTKDLRSKLLGQ